MIPTGKIRYCLHSEIDMAKWNRCIEGAGNGVVYANSFYLDIMAGSWDALVLNDYEAVMPLTWKWKYGFFYLYQPYFIPSLGVFGTEPDKIKVMDFLTAIPKKFRYWQIKLNEANALGDTMVNGNIMSTSSTNHLLYLNRSYAQIHSGYKRLCLRMIKKATDNQVEVVRDGKPVDVIEFYRKLYSAKHERISAKVYEKLVYCTSLCLEKGLVKIYQAKTPDGDIVAAYLVLVDKSFVYSLIGGSSEKGKQTGSFYLLTDAAIKDHAGSERVFRFEGSDIQGIAFFDAQFGPDLVSYLQLVKNALPFPFRMFKH